MYSLIYNPVAGRGRARDALARVVAFFDEARLPLEVLTTERPGHARELAAALPADARVIVLGGDGTLHEAAAACVGTERTLGVLPLGSGDDFAFALGLDRRDLAGALRIVRAGRVERVDSGVVNGQPFINVVGVGLDADVARAVGGAPPLLREGGAYLYAILTALLRLELGSVRVSVDGALAYHGLALLVSTHNGPRAGGAYLFAPDATLQSGRLDVLVAGRFSRLGALRILPKVTRGAHLDHPQIFLFRGREVVLEWNAARACHAEGEPIPSSARFEIAVRPSSLKVFC